MMRPMRDLIILICGLTVLAAAEPGAAAEPESSGYGIEVEIAPDPELAEAFQARAVVTDLATEEVLSAPRVRFLRGAEGRGRIRTGVAGGRSVYMEVEVDEDGKSATYRAEIRHGERLVSVQRIRVSLGEGEATE